MLTTGLRKRKNMKWRMTFLAWILFFCGLGVELYIDFSLRMQDDNPKTGGLSPIHYFGYQVLLALSSVLVAFLACRGIAKLYFRILIVVAQVVLGFVLYMLILLHYVLEYDIDSL